MDARLKPVFGFDLEKEVKPVGLQRMGLLIHGLGIVKMLDEIFSAIGPDLDLFQLIVSELGGKHCKLGMSPDNFLLLGRALLQVLQQVMGDEWDDELRSAWFQVIRVVSFAIAKSMQKRLVTVFDPMVRSACSRHLADCIPRNLLHCESRNHNHKKGTVEWRILSTEALLR